MGNLGKRDREELLSITRNLTLGRKAELIFLHCVHGEEIIGNDSWYIDEIAELYGISPEDGVYRNCYPSLYSFREIYNLMYTYPEGLEDRELRFEDIILEINLNRELRYFVRSMGYNRQPPIDDEYDKYEDYKAFKETISETQKAFGDDEVVSARTVCVREHIKTHAIICGILEFVFLFNIIMVNVENANLYMFFVQLNPQLFTTLSVVGDFIALIATTVILIIMIKRRDRKMMLPLFLILSLIYTIVLIMQIKFIAAVFSLAVTIYIFCICRKYRKG